MSIIAVIPARYGSTRFPGKPLALVKGVSMLQRVWACTMAARGVDDVLIATDDERIAEAAKAFGGKAVMTDSEIPNGTERALAAVKNVDCTHVINVQGDAVLTPPWIVGAIADALRADKDAAIATPAVKLTPDAYAQFIEQKKVSPASGTTVTMDLKGNALYFSKNVIPYVRDAAKANVYRHIGMYGYRLDALQRYVTLAPTPLEQTEKLEQLRALEHGIPIRVVPVEYRGRTHWSIDSPEDLTVAEQLIGTEGELLPTYDGSFKWKE